MRVELPKRERNSDLRRTGRIGQNNNSARPVARELINRSCESESRRRSVEFLLRRARRQFPSLSMGSGRSALPETDEAFVTALQSAVCSLESSLTKTWRLHGNRHVRSHFHPSLPFAASQPVRPGGLFAGARAVPRSREFEALDLERRRTFRACARAGRSLGGFRFFWKRYEVHADVDSAVCFRGDSLRLLSA